MGLCAVVIIIRIIEGHISRAHMLFCLYDVNDGHNINERNVKVFNRRTDEWNFLPRTLSSSAILRLYLIFIRKKKKSKFSYLFSQTRYYSHREPTFCTTTLSYLFTVYIWCYCVAEYFHRCSSVKVAHMCDEYIAAGQSLKSISSIHTYNVFASAYYIHFHPICFFVSSWRRECKNAHTHIHKGQPSRWLLYIAPGLHVSPTLLQYKIADGILISAAHILIHITKWSIGMFWLASNPDKLWIMYEGR